MKTKQAITVIAAALGLTVAAGPAGADRGSYLNWHVHDGGSGTDASGLVHRGLAFFPAILTGGDVGAYLQDPAYCPNATDKLTLPAGTNGQYPIVGVCMTNAFVIHLRAVPVAGLVPAGYQPTGATTAGAPVYYTLTTR